MEQKTTENLEETLDEIYMEHSGLECPVCRSTDIESGRFEADTNIGWQNCKCLNCESVWTDTYGLKGLTNLEIAVNYADTLIRDYKLVEMSDHEFARWLKAQGWNGDYTPLGQFNQFWSGQTCLALVKYKNDAPVNRWIWINTTLG